MKIFAILMSLISLSAWSGSSMKLEGRCTGTLKNNAVVAFSYYSNFNGCKNSALAAITYTAGIEGLFTGTRILKNNKDNYSFPKNTLTFADSTGNTSGTLKYFDGRSNQTIEVQCEIRDYEYGEC